MNELNYCSLEVSKRLVAAGIVLETEVYWAWDDNPEFVSHKPRLMKITGAELHDHHVAAYAFTELWRELPESMEDYELNIQKVGGGKFTSAAYCRADHAIYQCTQKGYHANTNPADAAAELLIWVRRQK